MFETPVAGKPSQVIVQQQQFDAPPPTESTKLPPTATPTAVGHETHWLQHVCGHYAV